jgi:hypothetical protein
MNDSQDSRADLPRPALAPVELAPADYVDPVIEAYKKDVDRTLLRENLKLTVEQRFRKLESFMKYAHELRASAHRPRRASEK